jgi:predicted glycoside hydrolase/deacetylase ChbG (UPF0249 family)
MSLQLGGGAVIINADDWGRTVETTDRTLDCLRVGAVSSVSAMVFMADSERSAIIAKEHNVDAGLHLNFTTIFDAPNCPEDLREHQKRIGRFLLAQRYARVLYHPGLAGSFEYVVATQLAEYERLYGHAPRRIDGHHHMHLCTNVMHGRLLPEGTIVRRNHSFEPGEKSVVNRVYRNWLDSLLARRHRMADRFFILPPVEPQSRLLDVFALAARYVIEVETHPINDEDYSYLMGDQLRRCLGSTKVARGYLLHSELGTGDGKETV